MEMRIYVANNVVTFVPSDKTCNEHKQFNLQGKLNNYPYQGLLPKQNKAIYKDFDAM